MPKQTVRTPEDEPKRQISIFIASRFSMQSERDLLHSRVFPQVNRDLRSLRPGFSATPVDLRWGVFTGTESLKDRTGIAARMCISTVKACAPFFLLIAGRDDGTTIPNSVYEPLLAEFQIPIPGFPLSVTGLEFVAALQFAQSQGIRPAVINYVEPSGSASPLADYALANGCEIKEFRNEEEFLRSACEAILDQILEAIPESAQSNWLDTEVAYQKSLVDRDCEYFVGRSKEAASIKAAWSTENQIRQHGIDLATKNLLLQARLVSHGNGLVTVLGQTGVGKSAFSAKLTREEGTVGDPRLAYVRVGSTPATQSLAVCLLLLVAQLEPAGAAPQLADRLPPDRIELDEVLPIWLEALSNGTPYVGPRVIIDGIDRFSWPPEQMGSWRWLPIDAGARTRILLTANEESIKAQALSRRTGTLIRLDHLPRNECIKLIEQRVLPYGKSIPSSIVTRLAERSGNPRWLSTAVGFICRASRNQLYQFLSKSGDLEDQIEMQLLVIVDSLPDNLAALHKVIYQHWIDQNLGPVRQLLETLALTNGLSTADITAVLQTRSSSIDSERLKTSENILADSVDRIGDEWQFSSISSRAGAVLLLQESTAYSESYGAVLASDIADRLRLLPLKNTIRERNLIPILTLEGRWPEILELVADPNRSTVREVEIAGASLDLLGSSALVHILNMEKSHLASLTAVELIVDFVRPHQGGLRPDIENKCLHIVATTPEGITTRRGRDTTQLDLLMRGNYSAEVREDLDPVDFAAACKLLDERRGSAFHALSLTVRTMERIGQICQDSRGKGAAIQLNAWNEAVKLTEMAIWEMRMQRDHTPQRQTISETLEGLQRMRNDLILTWDRR